MATTKLFYEQPETREINCLVVRIDYGHDGFSGIVLDGTPFYPDSGGQPCDTGTIAGLPVAAVIEQGDDIVHRVAVAAPGLEAAGIVPGATVRCIVDLERRRDHSEQHTAQHLLSAVLVRLLDARTLSFHLGERYSSIDLDVAPFERPDADAVEDEVLRVIRDDYRVLTHLCPPEDPESFPLRKEPSVEAGVLRVVEIDGIEYSACCGTHVRSTGALGLFRITRVEKYKGGCRVHFVAGGRAFGDYRRLAGVARDGASAAGVSEDELAAAVVVYREKLKGLEKNLDEARDAAAAAEAAGVDAASPAGRIVVAESPSIDAATRLARALAKRGRVSLVSCPSDLKAVASSPAPAEAGARPVDALFGAIARERGGKGGGGKTFFQTSFSDAGSLAAFVAAARLA